MKYTEIATGTITQMTWSNRLRKDVPTGETFPAYLIQFDTIQKGKFEFIIVSGDDWKEWMDSKDEYTGTTGYRSEKSARSAFRKLTK